MNKRPLCIVWLANMHCQPWLDSHIGGIQDEWPDARIIRATTANHALDEIEIEGPDILIMDPWVPEGESMITERPDFRCLQPEMGYALLDMLEDLPKPPKVMVYGRIADDRALEIEGKGVLALGIIPGLDEIIDAIKHQIG